MKYISLLLLLIFQSAQAIPDGKTPVSPSFTGSPEMMQAGEDLLYEVSYSFIKLGSIHVKVLPGKLVNGEPRYVAQIYIDSYKGIPFVSLHAVSLTEMDTNYYSRGYKSFEKSGSDWLGINYLFNLKQKAVIVEQGQYHRPFDQPYSSLRYDTLAVQQEWFEDALSLFFFARSRVHTNQTLSVQTLVYGKVGETQFNFSNHKSFQSIDAIPYPVRVVEFDGKAKFKGMFGMTGDFSGWFSDDAASIPIKAKLEVYVGSVTIELKQWKRAGWTPPK